MLPFRLLCSPAAPRRRSLAGTRRQPRSEDPGAGQRSRHAPVHQPARTGGNCQPSMHQTGPDLQANFKQRQQAEPASLKHLPRRLRLMGIKHGLSQAIPCTGVASAGSAIRAATLLHPGLSRACTSRRSCRQPPQGQHLQCCIAKAEHSVLKQAWTEPAHSALLDRAHTTKRQDSNVDLTACLRHYYGVSLLPCCINRAGHSLQPQSWRQGLACNTALATALMTTSCPTAASATEVMAGGMLISSRLGSTIRLGRSTVSSFVKKACRKDSQ